MLLRKIIIKQLDKSLFCPVLFITVMFGMLSFVTAEEPPLMARQMSNIQSASGRFDISGPSTMECVYFSKWSEDTALRIEHTIGIKLTVLNRKSVMRIVGSFSPEGLGVETSEASGKGNVSVFEDIVKGRKIRRLGLYYYDKADLEVVNESFCSLYLGAMVDGIKNEVVDVPAGDDEVKKKLVPQKRKKPQVPYWISEGVAQNMYRELRARNSERVYAMWRRGEVMPLQLTFKNERPDKAVCGLFVRFLLRKTEKGKLFEAIVSSLASGKKIDLNWLVEFVPDCNSLVELDEQWDKWILMQKTIVYQPGVMTAGLLEQFRSELLLFPGGFGIPIEDGSFKKIEWVDLISRRKEEWIPFFAGSKSISMRVLSIGRGEKFAEVVNSYCVFLEALGKRKSEKRLNLLLTDAENALKLADAEFKKSE